MTTSAHPGVAVISGAASGIGAATAPLLADAGFTVVGVDLAEAPPTLGDIPSLEWVRGDVSSQDTWKRVVQLCATHDSEGASAFVACAADVTVQPFLQTPIEEFSRLFEINVIGVVRGMQALIPAMIDRRPGAIAVTCSVNSLSVEENVSAYSASKSALLSVTRSAALEHARHGLRINAVCPGIVDTPLLRKHINSLADPAGAELAMKRRMPTGEITRPEEVAALIRFLLTEEASGLTGSALIVDGGLTSTYDFGGS